MAIIKVTKASSVQSIKRQFKKEFDCNIRIYNGNQFADEKMKISELSKTKDSGGELAIGPRSKVGNVEKYFQETFGIKVQISNADDTKLADNEMTLNQAGNKKIKANKPAAVNSKKENNLEVYQEFKKLCNLDKLERLDQTFVDQNIDLLNAINENFLAIKKSFFKEFPPEKNFKELVTFNLLYSILNSNYELYEFGDDFDSYETEKDTLISKFLDENKLYFPSFKNEVFSDKFAKYNIQEVEKSYELVKDNFIDVLDFAKHHVAFIIATYLSYGFCDYDSENNCEGRNSLYDNECEGEDSLNEFTIWVHKFIGDYRFENHNIIEELNDEWNSVFDIVLNTIQFLANERINDNEGCNKEEYCFDDSEDFSTFKYFEYNFNF